MITAAAPRPAPRPAARPTLLDPLLLDVTFNAPAPVEDAAAGEPDVLQSEFVGLALVPSVVVAKESVDALVVPFVLRGCWVKGAVVDVIPDQLVLPITVTVVG